MRRNSTRRCTGWMSREWIGSWWPYRRTRKRGWGCAIGCDGRRVRPDERRGVGTHSAPRASHPVPRARASLFAFFLLLGAALRLVLFVVPLRSVLAVLVLPLLASLAVLLFSLLANLAV